MPSGFHRIRHYGLIANTGRRNYLTRARELLLETADAVTPSRKESHDSGNSKITDKITFICPDCGAPMIIIDTFIRGQLPRAPPRVTGGSP